MTDRSRTTGDDGSRTTADRRSADASANGVRRREFVALGAGASATLLAGCAGEGSFPSSDGSDGSDGSQTLTGNFRLLISDAPADIDDFDELNVTLDRARIFEAGDGEGDEDSTDAEAEENADEDGGEESNDDDQNATDTDEDAESPNGTVDEDDEDDEDGDEGGRGFTVVDLDGATVDLTQVIEDDAIAVFDGEIPAGSYEKIELAVSDVQGIVEGSAVDVKLPSEKLQITNDFEVTADEPVSFVFDINVVKRGPNNGYILRPVISGSGVAGRDVEINEIDDEDGDERDESESEDDESKSEDDVSSDDGGDGTDDDGSEGGAAGNETAGGGS